MDTFARNALRVSLAGAGIVVLGASYIGQASAAEPADAGGSPDGTGSTAADAGGSPPATPTPQDLTAPDAPDPFVIPTVSDIAGL